jgi:hypothetical protein
MIKASMTGVLLLLACFWHRAIGQVVAMQFDKMNVAYTCVDNPLTIAVANVPSSDIVVSADYGTIKESAPGQYVFHSSRVGVAHILAKRKTANGLKLIKSFTCRVKSLPPPEVRLGGMQRGEMTRAMLRLQIAPRAIYLNFDIDAMAPIVSFTVKVRRNGSEIFNHTMSNASGTRFDSLTKDFFDYEVVKNDSIFLTQIKYRDCEPMPHELNSFAFRITDGDSKLERPVYLPGFEIDTVIDPVTGEERQIKRRRIAH